MTQQKFYPALGSFYLVKFVVPESLDSRAALRLIACEVAISFRIAIRSFRIKAEPKIISYSHKPDTQTLSSPMCSQDLSIGMVDTGNSVPASAPFAQSQESSAKTWWNIAQYCQP